MNWDQIKGYWKQLQGKVKSEYGRVTNDEIMQIGGKTDEFVGKLQKRYGYSKEETEKHVDAFIKKI